MAILQTPTVKMFKCTLNIFPPNVSNDRRALIVTLLQITLYQIWANRNSLKFDKIQPNILLSQLFIASNFTSRLRKHYVSYINSNGLAQFRQKFCHTPQVCNVVNNTTLVVNIL